VIDLLPLLKKGRRKAIVATALARALDTTEVEVRVEAAALNYAGHPVCSCQHGFFLADNVHELTEYIINLSRRRDALDERIGELLRILKGQLRDQG
jgi:hypothetical protein